MCVESSHYTVILTLRRRGGRSVAAASYRRSYRDTCSMVRSLVHLVGSAG